MNGANITPTASAGWGDKHEHFARRFVGEAPGGVWVDLKSGRPVETSAIDLALQISDDAARSDVECYAAGEWDNGVCWYDLSRAEVSGVFTADDIKHALSIANRAVQYIALRGEALSYRMLRNADNDMLVRFEVTA